LGFPLSDTCWPGRACRCAARARPRCATSSRPSVLGELKRSQYSRSPAASRRKQNLSAATLPLAVASGDPGRHPGGSSGSAILPALAGTCPGSDPNRLKGEPLVIEARSLPVGDRCLIAIGSPGSSPCRPSRRCVSVIRGEASDSLREGGQIEACQLLHDVSSDAGQGVRVGLFQAAQPGLG
jgi:hypothetical protein